MLIGEDGQKKIADPLLCWSLPLYIGCPNVEDELPSEAFIRLDPTNPQEAIEKNDPVYRERSVEQEVICYI